MDFEKCLTEHIKIHPALKPQDVIKFCYQATFGAEHLLSDTDAAKRYFIDEYDSTDPADMPLLEELNEKYSRVNIAAWKRVGLGREKLFEIFAASASDSSAEHSDRPGPEILKGYLLTAEKLITEIPCDITMDDWKSGIEKYIASGMNPVHHSEEYRKNYHPAYRVVKTTLLEEHEKK